MAQDLCAASTPLLRAVGPYAEHIVACHMNDPMSGYRHAAVKPSAASTLEATV
jgi:hypothetical protein